VRKKRKKERRKEKKEEREEFGSWHWAQENFPFLLGKENYFLKK
jgi:hypothetical protein